MKLFFTSLVVIFTFTNSWAQVQKSNWAGSYLAEDCLESDAKETSITPCYEYRLTITPTDIGNIYNCQISINGQMLFSKIKAKASENEDTLIINYIECIDGMDFDLKEGECFLVIEKKNSNIITNKATFHNTEDWNNKLPVFKKNN